MKLRCYAIVALFLLVMTNSLVAKTLMYKYLSKLAILESRDGRKLESYEDIDPIIFNPFQKRNKPYPMVNSSELPNGYVDKKTAEKYFKLFNSHPIVGDDYMNFRDFMNQYFYLTQGQSDIKIQGFPYVFTETREPGSFSFNICMDDGYKYIKRFRKFSPDALSCRECRELCGSKCDKLDSRKTMYGVAKRKHIFGKNNIYSDFKNKLLSSGNSITDYGQQIKLNKAIEIDFKDRTPPIIAYGLKELGGYLAHYACTTGDWYEVASMPFIDNSPKLLAKYSFGRVAECPPESEMWTDYEDWKHEENVKLIDLEKDEALIDIVKFNHRAGVVRYSIFAQEISETANLNPSCTIQPDRPDICYGHKSKEDLGKDPLTAKPWPDKRNLDDVLEKGCETGNMRIYDNDCPNILIRITNTETGQKFFFPPCFPAGAFKVVNSSTYKSFYGIGKTNQEDYDAFIGEELDLEYNHTYRMKNSEMKPDFTIYKAEDKDMAAKNESLALEKLVLNKDIRFINENLRLEDYFYSDNAEDGKFSHSLRNGSFGKRRGTLRNMVVLYENTGGFRFKKDVEYKVDVWTDDNVKWNNTRLDLDSRGEYKVFLLDYPVVYPTGLSSGTIIANFPNEYEPHKVVRKIDINKSINGDISFTFKDKTASIYDFESIEAFDEFEFPYIEVIAQDYEGWERRLKLYFRVDDRGTDVRPIESSKNKK